MTCPITQLSRQLQADSLARAQAHIAAHRLDHIRRSAAMDRAMDEQSERRNQAWSLGLSMEINHD